MTLCGLALERRLDGVRREPEGSEERLHAGAVLLGGILARVADLQDHAGRTKMQLAMLSPRQPSYRLGLARCVEVLAEILEGVGELQAAELEVRGLLGLRTAIGDAEVRTIAAGQHEHGREEGWL